MSDTDINVTVNVTEDIYPDVDSTAVSAAVIDDGDSIVVPAEVDFGDTLDAELEGENLIDVPVDESVGIQGDHRVLLHRDAANQHPMSAITGLGDALDAINTELSSRIGQVEAESAELEVDMASALLRIGDLQDQVDGNITTWFYAAEPSMNLPPVTLDPSNPQDTGWDTPEKKNAHKGDLYYNTLTGYAYRFAYADGDYGWMRITDTDVVKALADAAHAQDTADSKRRVFYSTPYPPYDKGDLWVQGSSGDILVCTTSKPADGSYAEGDWSRASKYTDDYVANIALASANGKNTVYHQPSQPTGGTYKKGDTWFDTDDDYTMYTYDGALWIKEQFGNEAIADLSITNAKIANATIEYGKIKSVDAGKITVGTLDAARIGTGTITIGKINTDTQAEILNSNIEVGGRNLIRNTNNYQGWYVSGSQYITYSGDTVTISASGLTALSYARLEGEIVTKTANVRNGDYYTLSFEIMSPDWSAVSEPTTSNTGFAAVMIQFVTSDSPTGSQLAYLSRRLSVTAFWKESPTPTNNKWLKFVSVPFQYNNDSQWSSVSSGFGEYIRVGPQLRANGTIKVRNIKFEKGNKATDWTPAPEDGVNENLLIDTQKMSAWFKGSTHSIDTSGEFGVITLNGASSSWVDASSRPTIRTSILDGTPLWLSFEYKASAAISSMFVCLSGTAVADGSPSVGPRTKYSGNRLSSLPAASSWTRKVIAMPTTTAEIPYGSGDVNSLYVQFFNRTDNTTLQIRKVKLEHGLSATDWTPSAEDQKAYITRIDNAGIRIHPSSTENNSVVINASGMEVYKGGNSVAFYGSDIRLGEETSSRLFITSDGIDAYTPNGIQLFSLNKNGGLKNQYARLKQWQTTAQSVNLSTTLGSAWTNLSAGQIFRIRGTCYYETASDVGVAYARPFEQFTKGTASTRTVITYDGNNTLTISTSGMPSGGTYEYSELEFLKVDIVQAPFYNFADDGPTSGGANSFVIGTGTIAGNPNQLALGAYNAERLNGLLIVGGGTSSSSRKNLAVVTDTGDLFLKGNLYVSSNDAGTSGTKANSGIDIASKITFGSAWTQQVKVARRIGNMVFFQLEANAGTFNANTNYVLANIASGYRPAIQQFATGITTDGSYNPKGTVSAVLKTDGSINIRTQTASSSGAYVFVSGFYYTA